MVRLPIMGFFHTRRARFHTSQARRAWGMKNRGMKKRFGYEKKIRSIEDSMGIPTEDGRGDGYQAYRAAIRRERRKLGFVSISPGLYILFT